MKMYPTVVLLTLAVLCRPSMSDHDSGEIEFGDSDVSFFNPYEHYSQGKLTGSQTGGRTISPNTGQFVGQSDDKEDFQYVYVSPSGGQMVGQNTGQFNSRTLISSGEQIQNKPADSDDQYITIHQANGQTGWQSPSQVAEKTVYTPTGLFTNQNTGQFVPQPGGQFKSHSAGQISVQTVQPFTHSSNMAIEVEDDHYLPSSHKSSQHISTNIGQPSGVKTDHSQSITGGILLNGQSANDQYVQVGQNIGVSNSKAVIQNDMPYTIKSSGPNNDKNDDKYLPVGLAGGQTGTSQGHSGQSKDNNYQNTGKYATTDQSDDQGGVNSLFVNQNIIPYTIQSSGQLDDKKYHSDDKYLPIGQTAGQIGSFNSQFATQNMVPSTIQSSGHLDDKNDHNDDKYLPIGQTAGQIGSFNSQFATQNIVPPTIQSSGHLNDKNDDTYEKGRQSGGLFNGQNVVSYTFQSSDQSNDGIAGNQLSALNSFSPNQYSVPHTIQTSGQSSEREDDQFEYTGQPFTQTSAIHSDQDDDRYQQFRQMNGQRSNQFTGQSFVQGDGGLLGQQIHATAHLSGSSVKAGVPTVDQTQEYFASQPITGPAVQTDGQFVSGANGKYHMKPSRLSIGQYPGQPDRPEFLTQEPVEKDVDAGGMCNNYKTKGGWAYRPIYGSCNQYLQCNSDNMASLLTCAAGTFYDGTSCRHSAEVYCPYDPCQAHEPGFKYTDGQSCYGYYKCVKGKSRYHTCPDGFYFNSNEQICISDDTCQKNNLIHPCSYGTTYPFPGRPEMFYLYDGREIFYPMKCPQGLWYRPDICSCDWIVPGISNHEGCKPMYHFQYNGNFLEAYNRIQQVPNTGVAIYRKSALFSEGGQIMIWAMNNMNLDKEFAFCFEFMAKVYNGEVALLSNGYKDNDFTYKITYIPAQSLVKAYIELDDGTTAHLVVNGVLPLKPHFVRLAKYGSKIKLRIDNIRPTMVKTPAEVQTSNSPLVIGAAQGCTNFVGHFDEFKFFKCVPNDFFNDYAEKKK